MGNLERQFPRVAQYQHRNLILTCWKGIGIELVKGGEYKNCRFAHSGLSLADDIHSENGLRDTFVLYFGGVLKTTVNDGAEAFWF